MPSAWKLTRWVWVWVFVWQVQSSADDAPGAYSDEDGVERQSESEVSQASTELTRPSSATSTESTVREAAERLQDRVDRAIGSTNLAVIKGVLYDARKFRPKEKLGYLIRPISPPA